jgi:hypothetical protein
MRMFKQKEFYYENITGDPNLAPVCGDKHLQTPFYITFKNEINK